MTDAQENILDHYHNPRNYGILSSYTHSAKLENISCGDEITIYLNVVEGKIKEVSFEAQGCSIAIASASILTEDLKGKSLRQIKDFKEEDLFELLSLDLVSRRQNCALLSLQSLQKALML